MDQTSVPERGDDLSQIRAAAQRRRSALVTDLERLVACESPSSDVDALRRAADVLTDVARLRLGSEPCWRGETLPHLRWSWPDDDAARSVVVLTHFDTVWPLGTVETFPFGVDDRTATGPGTFDMKAGIVIAVHALAVLQEIGGDDALDGVCLVATADEEVGSATSRPVIESVAQDSRAVLVMEGAGPDGSVKTARKGTSNYTVVVRGRAAHAGLEPERGRNSALEASRIMLAAAGLADPELGTTVTPTMVRAGSSRNTVPDLAEIALDVRSATEAEQRRVDQELRSLAEKVDHGCAVEVSGGPNRPPMQRETSAALFELARQVNGRLGLAELGEVAVGGGSDGNFTAALGVPTLDGLGAVGGGAHARDEHVELDGLVDRIALVAGLIAEVRATGPLAGSPSGSAADSLQEARR